MTTIRVATGSDLEALVEMGQALHDESPRYQGMGYSPTKLRSLFKALQGTMLTAVGCVYIAEHEGAIIGMAVCVVADRFFSDVRYVTDLTLYVRPEYRGKMSGGKAFQKLVGAMEQWAAGEGVSDLAFGVSTEIHAVQTVAAYEKMGYRLAGYTMVKQNGH